MDSKNSITIIAVTTADGHYECIIFGHYDPSVPTSLARDTLSGDSDVVPLLILVAILRHAGGRAEEKLWGLQFVIGPMNPQTTEVGSMCAKLSGRQFVRALGRVKREFAF